MTDRSTSHGYRPLGWLTALALLALWSCGTPEKQYEMLSFFFDGVPLPPSMRPTVEDAQGNRVALVVVSHEPYAADRCVECHGNVGKFSMSLSGYSGVKADVCLKCHGGIQAEFPLMHGPVAAMECLTCHEPHESSFPHLLKQPVPKLCLECHVAQDVQASGLPAHEDLTSDCLGCHHGHGGHDSNLLRIDLTPRPPADAPPAAPGSEAGQ